MEDSDTCGCEGVVVALGERLDEAVFWLDCAWKSSGGEALWLSDREVKDGSGGCGLWRHLL